MNNFLLGFVSFLAILSGVLVITSKNPVIAVIFLISLFINTALFLILLEIGFLGISYIIIYVGGITVLFLFIVLMINIRIIEVSEVGREYTKNIPLALLVGFLFIFEFFSLIPFGSYDVSFFNFVIDLIYHISGFFLNINSSSINLPLENFLYYSPDFLISNFTQIEVLGQGLYTYGAIWLIISSLILLLSMASAIFLSKTNS